MLQEKMLEWGKTFGLLPEGNSSFIPGEDNPPCVDYEFTDFPGFCSKYALEPCTTNVSVPLDGAVYNYEPSQMRF